MHKFRTRHASLEEVALIVNTNRSACQQGSADERSITNSLAPCVEHNPARGHHGRVQAHGAAAESCTVNTMVQIWVQYIAIVFLFIEHAVCFWRICRQRNIQVFILPHGSCTGLRRMQLSSSFRPVLHEETDDDEESRSRSSTHFSRSRSGTHFARVSSRMKWSNSRRKALQAKAKSVQAIALHCDHEMNQATDAGDEPRLWADSRLARLQASPKMLPCRPGRVAIDPDLDQRSFAAH